MAAGCEFEFMEYMDEQSINSNLICHICTKPFKDPVCTPCDHSFGKSCIGKWLTENNKPSCPMCTHQPMSSSNLVPAARLIKNMLDELPVRCTLCDKTNLQRGQFADHIGKICPQATVSCTASDIKCSWTGTRADLNQHLAECKFEPLRPVLAILIEDNRQLRELVQEHTEQIEDLSKRLSKLNDVNDDTDDQSDASSVTSSTVDDVFEKEENAIFVRNIPVHLKFNELFTFFSKIGRIRFNPKTQKSELFIFKKLDNKKVCNIKVVYVDKATADAAVAEFNHRNVPEWNTRLLVEISKRKSNKPADNAHQDNRRANEDQSSKASKNPTSSPSPSCAAAAAAASSSVNPEEAASATSKTKEPRKRNSANKKN